jgi:hypothetical protein
VKNRFQSSPFKCNLQRYNVAAESAADAASRRGSAFLINLTHKP